MPRHELSLADQMESDGIPKRRGSSGKRKRKAEETDEASKRGNSDGTRILRVARLQQEEVEAEARGFGSEIPDVQEMGRKLMERKAREEAEMEESDEEEYEAFFSDRKDSEGYVLGTDVDVTESDERAIEAFMKRDGEMQKTLGDVILERVRQKQGWMQPGDVVPTTMGTDERPVPEGMDERVVQIYVGVGDLMQRYTTGKVPKAFKVIPSLHNWEEMLYLTGPDRWSPHATYQATRLFASNLNAKQAQRFYSLVLLPKVRQDIKKNRKLHFALFQALLKATYKPAAFYKGILLPLCRSGTCTLREAVIISSALQKASIPVLHSAAAVLRIASMEYSGVNSFFLRVLLDKKYALPLKVVDALVDHFMAFVREERELPVVWHQSLLCFVQRYKADIRDGDKESLLKLIEIQNHYLVSPEIARELQHTAQDTKNNRKLAKLPKPMEEDIRDLPPVPLGDI